MKEIRNTMKTKRALFGSLISLALLSLIASLALPSGTATKADGLTASARPSLLAPSVANPNPPSDMCQNMQVLVLLDRSGSVTNQGSVTVQKYKDQVKKVWSTLHNISKTYGGYSSGYLWAFAGRTADQMPRLLARDNNGDGVVNEADRNLNDPKVLSAYQEMTQDIYFRNDSQPMFPSNQTASYGYNPKNEDTRYFTKPNFTNWHESFLMAQDTIASANAPGNAAKDYSMVIIVTDGDPTVNDGPNHTWDTFARNKKIDEVFDGSTSTTSHVTRTKEVVDALRSGQVVNNSSRTFTPVSVQGILIGGSSNSTARMNTAFGTGNWVGSSNFDTTLGAQLLSIVGATCPPSAVLQGAMTAEIVSGPTNAIEESDVTLTVDVTNTGNASLNDVSVSNGTVISVPTDPKYSDNGILAPGNKRRFSVKLSVGGGANTASFTIPYSARVDEDPSLLIPGSPRQLSGNLTYNLGVTLVPRPS